MDDLLLKYLVRSYYFAEAMTFYELYYDPLVSTYEPARTRLQDPGRQEDRPPTWVPIVFHCTTLELAPQIFESGFLKPGVNGTVSFTEIPIGELDRMKWRKGAAPQIAIGFPRRFIETLEFAPVLYLKHHPTLKKLLEKLSPSSRAQLTPFVDLDDDVAPFQEIRTTSPVAVEEAIWILTTFRQGDPPRPTIPSVEKFKEKYGPIAQSYWHRTHQLGLLHEWQYTRSTRNTNGELTEFRFIGEHYWKQQVVGERKVTISLPTHKRNLLVPTINRDLHSQYEGPWNFIDVAKLICGLITECGKSLTETLRYRLIKDIEATI